VAEVAVSRSGLHQEHGGATVWPPPRFDAVRDGAEALVRARALVELRLAEEQVVAERRVAGVEQRFADRLTHLERCLDQQVADAEARAAEAVAERIAVRIAEVEAQLSARADEAITAISRRIDAIETRCALDAARVDELVALAGRLDDVIAAVNLADADRRDELATFRQQLADGLRLIDHIEPIRARCASLSQATAQLQDEVAIQRTTLTDGLATIELQLRDVEQAMAGDAMAEISAHLDRVEELERAVAELNPDRFVTRDELRANG